MTEAETWANAPIEAVCVAFSRGLPSGKHRKVFGITPKTTAASLPFDEALWSQTDDGDEDPKTIVQVDRLGDWNVSIEPNGFIASLPEVTSSLSANGEAIVAFWNVNYDATFLRAIAGEVVRRFDPVAKDLDDGLGDPLPEEDGLPWDDEWRGSLMVLVERLVGVELTPQWLLERERATYIGKQPTPRRTYDGLYGDPELDDLLAHSDLDVVRVSLARAIEVCAAHVGLADDPQLHTHLATFRAAWGPTLFEEVDGAPRRVLWFDAAWNITADYSRDINERELRGEKIDPHTEYVSENPTWARMQVAMAAFQLLGSYPEERGKDLLHAQMGLGSDWPALRDELVAILSSG